MKTFIPMSVVANECLLQLVDNMKRKGAIGKFKTQRIFPPIGSEMIAARDTDSEICIGVGWNCRDIPAVLEVLVKKIDGNLVTVPVRMDSRYETTSVDFISRQWIAPAMAYLAELLVPSRMPSDAPDYVYMGV